MSNWGWPQWVMAILLIDGLIRHIMLELENSQKTTADVLLDTLEKNREWKRRMALRIVLILFEGFVLIKGGFWG